MHELSMFASSSRRSLLVDVELELVDVELVLRVDTSAGAANSSERENEPKTCEASQQG